MLLLFSSGTTFNQMSTREIHFGTSFHSKEILSLKCAKISIETEYAVRIVIAPNMFDENDTSYGLDIYGRDEDRVVKAFITIVNLFPKTFKGENSKVPFPTTISTFDGILDHPRSFGMGFHWTC